MVSLRYPLIINVNCVKRTKFTTFVASRKAAYCINPANAQGFGRASILFRL